MSKEIKHIFEKAWVRHLLFWLVVLSFYTTRARMYYDSTWDLISSNVLEVINQAITAYVILLVIVPIYHKRKKVFEIVLLLFLLAIIMNLIYIFNSNYLLGPNYNCCYREFKVNHDHLTLWQQLYEYKYNFTKISWNYIQPLFFLVALQFYEKQQKVSELNEQKKIAELNALKHQLNPHFLFNTLNNLYALALKKSDQAPVVIEKLSDILDYIIYRCQEKFVPLVKEVQMLENYISLEQVRYSSRVKVRLNSEIDNEVRIAPLILLTFVENAFKHGVTEALGDAKIEIDIKTTNEAIHFSCVNSKPETNAQAANDTKSVGLKNIQQQLELIYGNDFKLEFKENQANFAVQLKLPIK